MKQSPAPAPVGDPVPHPSQRPASRTGLEPPIPFNRDEPPWVRRRVCGLGDLPVGGLGSSLPVMLFELNRGQVPDRGVEPVDVVPVDPAGTCHSTSRRSVQAGPARLIASVLNSPMVDSHKALSRASPTVPMEPVIPASRSSAVKVTDTYCDPASE